MASLARLRSAGEFLNYLIPTRTERHALAQSRRPLGITRYSLRSENPGISQPSRGLVLTHISQMGTLLNPARGSAASPNWGISRHSPDRPFGGMSTWGRTARFVSYLRVSTNKQGALGLGIEAQRRAVEDYLNGGLLDRGRRVRGGRERQARRPAQARRGSGLSNGTACYSQSERVEVCARRTERSRVQAREIHYAKDRTTWTKSSGQ